ncbi:hypothetical protein ACFQH2_14015 [Natronoarchaeum sp. GCM10025703]|uniref:hypothetical protein n=1 Tax=unclassified Natronoarchaeum TaxID=2620183 RepID=UPI00360E79AC
MTDDQDSDQEPALQDAEFPSSTSGLEEARRRFDLEQERSDVIENKAGTVFALNAIIITVTSIIEGLSSHSTVIIIFLSMLSAGQALRVLSVYDYQRPMQNARNISRYINFSKEEFDRKFIELYIESTENNRSINNERVKKYRISLFLIILAVTVLALLTVEAQLNLCSAI